MLSDGTPWRPLVHAKDIARAFAAALTAPKEAVHDKAFNVGTEHNNVTVAEIAAARSSRRCPASTLGSPARPAPTRAPTGSTSPGSARRSPASSRDWSVKDGARRADRGLPEFGLTERGLPAALHPAGLAQRARRRRRDRRHPAAAVTRTGPGDRRDLQALVERLYPLCRSITGDGVRRTAGHPRRAHRRWRSTRYPTGTAGAGLDRAAGVEHPRRLRQGSRTAAGSSTSASRTCTSSATASRCHGTMPLAELREHLHTLPDQPALVPVPDQLLRAGLGLLPRAGHARRAARRRLRGVHRLHSGRRPPHLRRARRARARSPTR